MRVDQKQQDAVAAWYEFASGERTSSEMLSRTCDWVGSEAAHIIYVEKESREIRSTLVSTVDNPSMIREFYEHYSKINPLMPKAFPYLSRGEIVQSAHIISNRELRRTEFYNDYMVRIGSAYEMGGVCERRADHECVLIFGQPATYMKSQVERLTALVPHINRAIAIARCLQQREQLTVALSALNDCSFIALNQKGEVLEEHGPIAERLRADRLIFLVDQRRLAFGNRILDAHYQQLVFDLANENSLSESFSCQYGDSRLRFTMIPVDALSSMFIRADASFLMLIQEEQQTLQQFFGRCCDRLYLTPKERQISFRLVSGDTIAEIAGLLSVSPHTIRTHVKTIMRKAGCHSQGELTALLTGRRHFKGSG